jgi:hypothetical protein
MHAERGACAFVHAEDVRGALVCVCVCVCVCVSVCLCVCVCVYVCVCALVGGVT